MSSPLASRVASEPLFVSEGSSSFIVMPAWASSWLASVLPAPMTDAMTCVSPSPAGLSARPTGASGLVEDGAPLPPGGDVKCTPLASTVAG